MKVSKEQAARNRIALVEAAARLFGERGIDGVGVAEISKEAGLTHGALYAQFPSKEALAAEALTYGLLRGYARLTAGPDDRPPALAGFLDFYLSKQHRDDVAGGCVMAASATEIARQDPAICARFTEGFERMVGVLEAALAGTGSAEDRRQRAVAMASAMIGGVAVARAAAKARPELSDEILAAVRRVLGQLGGAPAAAAPERAAIARPDRRVRRPAAGDSSGRARGAPGVSRRRRKRRRRRGAGPRSARAVHRRERSACELSRQRP